MNIKFNKIIIKDFLSIGEAEIVLDDTGYVLVQGKNLVEDDNASSNGSGKSSIFEAISWVLTGETIRGTKQSVSNIKTENGAYVEIDFEVDDKNIKLIRTKDHKKFGTTLRFFVNGEDKSGKGIRDTSKIVLEYLPDITPSLLGSVVILGQNLPQRFSNNTPSGRKEVLESLSKSDFMISDLKQRVSDRKSVISDKIRTLETENAVLENKRSMLVSSLESLKSDINDFGTSDSITEEIGLLKNEINSLISRINCIKNVDIENIDKDVDALRGTYKSLSKRLKQLEEEKESEKRREADRISELFDNEISQCSESINNLSAEKGSLSKEIETLSSIVDVCPTCGQKIHGVKKPDTSELERSFDDVLKLLSTEKEKYSSLLSNKKKEMSDSDEKISSAFDKRIKSIKDEIDKTVADGNRLKEERTRKSVEEAQCREKILSIDSSISHLNEKLLTFNAELSRLKERKISTEKDIREIDEKILYNSNSREDMERRLEVINSFSTIVSRDFRGFLLRNLINYIDRTAKEYSMCVFDTDKINFSLNGNNIDIGYCGKSYENLSSGEKQKVDLIVQFSIRDMLCKCLGFGCNILVLDEIFDGLDFIGCQKVIDMIASKLQDIGSIFIVTHRADLSIPYDKTIVVEKNRQGISYVNDVL